MTEKTIEIKQRTANIVLAIGGLNGFVSKEVQNSTSVLRLNFCAKNPAHRQYAKRYRKPHSRRLKVRNPKILLSRIVLRKLAHDFALNRSKKLHNRWFVPQFFPSLVFSEQILVGLLQNKSSCVCCHCRLFEVLGNI